jgi:hypothetical protein
LVVHVVGDTGIELAGSTKTGPDEWTIGPVFLRKYEPTAGDVLYTVQCGVGSAVLGEGPEAIDAAEFDALPTATAVDVFSGAVYVAGGGWPDETTNLHPFAQDARVDKLNTDDGSYMWSAFLNAPLAGVTDVDAGSQVIVMGGTCCVTPGAAVGTGAGYLVKFDEDGNEAFRNIFTDGFLRVSSVSGMAANAESVFTIGWYSDREEAFTTGGPELPPEFLLKKFDYAGNELDSINLVPAEAVAVAVDSSQVYVVGLTAGDPSGQLDVYLRIYAIS